MLIRADALHIPLPDQSVDAIVTDPPAGISFMGKAWDGDRGGRCQWVEWMTAAAREMLRCLKPGGHALVWAIPRTSHWTATALEAAGFQVRDVITHHFGSGFPKSLDVSKAIDRAAGAEREVIGINPSSRPNSKRRKSGGFDSQQGEDSAGLQDVTAPATDAAKQWEGFGTALKPASEHWILCRKPLIGTVAANVLEHGTGALNIDASRIGTESTIRKSNKGTNGEGWRMGTDSHINGSENGRWPANLVLTHSHDCGPICVEGCPVGELDRQSGISKSIGGKNTQKNDRELRMGRTSGEGANAGGLGDSGGASRFFYTAKPSTAERNSGGSNSHPTVKPSSLMSWLIRLITPPGGLVLDPFFGSGTTGKAATENGFRFVGVELEREYVELARERVRTQIGFSF